MKIRLDFVTNSSSTSFIISLKDELNEKNFMRAIGIRGESQINEFFADLFEAIENNKEDIITASKRHSNVDGFLKAERFDLETIKHVQKLLSEGRKVYYGTLHSTGQSAAESYFCTESFLVCDEDIYFNGQIGDW